MFSLTYSSKANDNFSQDEILELLYHARKFNKKNKITGCLLYLQNEFLQYLEGEEEIILNLFRRIKEDDRHGNVKLLSYDYSTTRVFVIWEMLYENFRGTDDQLEYLKLLMSLFVENPNISSAGNPTSQSFWKVVNELLSPESTDK